MQQSPGSFCAIQLPFSFTAYRRSIYNVVADYIYLELVTFLLLVLVCIAAEKRHQVDKCDLIVLQPIWSNRWMRMAWLVAAAWSKNTHSTRNSQWRSYLEFCSDNGLNSKPAKDLTVAWFLLRKAKSSTFSTLNNHLSAIIALHECNGFEPKFRST